MTGRDGTAEMASLFSDEYFPSMFLKQLDQEDIANCRLVCSRWKEMLNERPVALKLLPLAGSIAVASQFDSATSLMLENNGKVFWGQPHCNMEDVYSLMKSLKNLKNLAFPPDWFMPYFPTEILPPWVTKAIKCVQNLHSLDMGGTFVGLDAAKGILDNIPDLKKFSYFSVAMDPGDRALTSLGNLEELQIVQEHLIDRRGRIYLQNQPSLKKLHLVIGATFNSSNPRMYQLPVLLNEIHKSLTSLAHLKIDKLPIAEGNKLTTIRAEILRHYSGLELLELSHVHISGNDFFGMLQMMCRLKTLGLTELTIDKQTKTFSCLSSLENLNRISVAPVYINSTAAELDIPDFSNFSKLIRLNVYRNAGPVSVKCLKSLRDLHYVCKPHIEMVHIYRLRHSVNLEALYLDTKAFCSSFVLRSMKNLKKLVIRAKVDGDFCQTLRQMDKLTHLEFSCLSEKPNIIEGINLVSTLIQLKLNDLTSRQTRVLARLEAGQLDRLTHLTFASCTIDGYVLAIVEEKLLQLRHLVLTDV